MRIGLFGGSFDPIHLGHLLIAVHAWESLRLDQLRLVPAAHSPLKPTDSHTAAEHRLEMVRLAVGGTPFLEVDDRELKRGGTSYTVDTLQSIHDELPEADLVLIIGSDSLASFPRWHQPERLLQLATLAVVERGGEAESDFSVLNDFADSATIEKSLQHRVAMPQIEISSSEIRRRVAAKQAIRFQTPRAVEAYIEAHKLYTK